LFSIIVRGIIWPASKLDWGRCAPALSYY